MDHHKKDEKRDHSLSAAETILADASRGKTEHEKAVVKLICELVNRSDFGRLSDLEVDTTLHDTLKAHHLATEAIWSSSFAAVIFNVPVSYVPQMLCYLQYALVEQLNYLDDTNSKTDNSSPFIQSKSEVTFDASSFSQLTRELWRLRGYCQELIEVARKKKGEERSEAQSPWQSSYTVTGSEVSFEPSDRLFAVDDGYRVKLLGLLAMLIDIMSTDEEKENFLLKSYENEHSGMDLLLKVMKKDVLSKLTPIASKLSENLASDATDLTAKQLNTIEAAKMGLKALMRARNEFPKEKKLKKFFKDVQKSEVMAAINNEPRTPFTNTFLSEQQLAVVGLKTIVRQFFEFIKVKSYKKQDSKSDPKLPLSRSTATHSNFFTSFPTETTPHGTYCSVSGNHDLNYHLYVFKCAQPLKERTSKVPQYLEVQCLTALPNVLLGFICTTKRLHSKSFQIQKLSNSLFLNTATFKLIIWSERLQRCIEIPTNVNEDTASFFPNGRHEMVVSLLLNHAVEPVVKNMFKMFKFFLNGKEVIPDTKHQEYGFIRREQRDKENRNTLILARPALAPANFNDLAVHFEPAEWKHSAVVAESAGTFAPFITFTTDGAENSNSNSVPSDNVDEKEDGEEEHSDTTVNNNNNEEEEVVVISNNVANVSSSPDHSVAQETGQRLPSTETDGEKEPPPPKEMEVKEDVTVAVEKTTSTSNATFEFTVPRLPPPKKLKSTNHSVKRHRDESPKTGAPLELAGQQQQQQQPNDYHQNAAFASSSSFSFDPSSRNESQSEGTDDLRHLYQKNSVDGFPGSSGSTTHHQCPVEEVECEHSTAKVVAESVGFAPSPKFTDKAECNSNNNSGVPPDCAEKKEEREKEHSGAMLNNNKEEIISNNLAKVSSSLEQSAHAPDQNVLSSSAAEQVEKVQPEKGEAEVKVTQVAENKTTTTAPTAAAKYTIPRLPPSLRPQPSTSHSEGSSSGGGVKRHRDESPRDNNRALPYELARQRHRSHHYHPNTGRVSSSYSSSSSSSFSFRSDYHGSRTGARERSSFYHPHRHHHHHQNRTHDWATISGSTAPHHHHRRLLPSDFHEMKQRQQPPQPQLPPPPPRPLQQQQQQPTSSQSQPPPPPPVFPPLQPLRLEQQRRRPLQFLGSVEHFTLPPTVPPLPVVYPKRDWPLPPDEPSPGQCAPNFDQLYTACKDHRSLGRGAHGSVSLFEHNSSRMVYAVKISHHKLSKAATELLKADDIPLDNKEFKKLSVCKYIKAFKEDSIECLKEASPNLLTLLGFQFRKRKSDYDEQLSIYQLCEIYFPMSMSLAMFQKKIKYRLFRPSDLIYAMRQVLNGIHCLHLHDLIHGDVKADNILLQVPSGWDPGDDEAEAADDAEFDRLMQFLRYDGSIKLGDYSSLVEKGVHQCNRNLMVGTREIRPPEVFLNTGFSFPMDVWGLGITGARLYFPKASPHERKFIPGDSSHEVLYMIDRIVGLFASNLPKNKRPPKPWVMETDRECCKLYFKAELQLYMKRYYEGKIYGNSEEKKSAVDEFRTKVKDDIKKHPDKTKWNSLIRKPDNVINPAVLQEEVKPLRSQIEKAAEEWIMKAEQDKSLSREVNLLGAVQTFLIDSLAVNPAERGKVEELQLMLTHALVLHETTPYCPNTDATVSVKCKKLQDNTSGYISSSSSSCCSPTTYY